MSIQLDCPRCKQPCGELKLKTAIAYTRSDARLVKPDGQTPAISITAICKTCLLRHVLLAPMIASQTQSLQLVADEKAETLSQDPKTALASGRH